MNTQNTQTQTNEDYKYVFFKNTIIDNIDFDGYGLSNDMYLYDKILTVYNIFKKEYVHENNKHINETVLFREWLQGLPSVLTVPFYYFEILENAKKAGYKFNSEKKEDNFCENYWMNLAKTFFLIKTKLQYYK